MKITNKYNLPKALVRAIENDPYTYTGKISVTQLIQPPRLRWLLRRHDDTITQDVTDMLWMLLGSAVHYVLERGEDKQAAEIQEVRATATLDGWEISGKPDLWVAPNKLYDYKFTSVWATINDLKREWSEQLNMLAYLYRESGFPVDKAYIMVIYRDWSRTQAKRGGKYPQVGAENLPVPLWTNKEVEEFIIKRIKLHKESEDLSDENLPYCTDEECWMKPNTWAVMKNKNKRASRVFESEEEAQKLLNEYAAGKPKDKFRIEFRQGEYTRCEHYCPVNMLCNQHLYRSAENV